MPDRTWTLTSPSGSTSHPPINPAHITITTPRGTDIWRPSLSTQENRFDAPHLTTPIPSGAFKALTATITGKWERKFDQGGLLLVWPGADGMRSKWLKAGIEFFQGRPALSVVGTDRVSDWSLAPLPPNTSGEEGVTVRVEREGRTLWVYYLPDGVEGGEKVALREIKWAWMEGREDAGSGMEVLVGVAVARPDEEGGEGELEVEFRDLRLEVEG